MPLIIITGIPCSGKTTRTSELKEYFINKGKNVEVINEIDIVTKRGFDRNKFYAGQILFYFTTYFNFIFKAEHTNYFYLTNSV